MSTTTNHHSPPGEPKSEPEPQSLNRHLFNRLKILTDVETNTSSNQSGKDKKSKNENKNKNNANIIANAATKIQVLKSFEPYLRDVDGYLRVSSHPASSGSSSSNNSNNNTGTALVPRGELPALEWNAQWRKAYTLLLWLRPVMGDDEVQTTILEDDQQHKQRRILYRFATAPDDATATAGGVCATLGEWRVIEDDNLNDDDDGEGTYATNIAKRGPRRRRKVQTQVTVYSLPYQAPDLVANMGKKEESGGGQGGRNEDRPHSASETKWDAKPYVIAPLELEEGQWSLVGITHVFPYLNRPHWTMCVNGRLKGSGELPYPVLEKTPVMSFNTLLDDPIHGGCTYFGSRMTDTSDDVITDASHSSTRTKPDHAKNASELQSQVASRYSLQLHLATFSLCNEILSPTIQALLAQAGPQMSLASHGTIPMLPPIANWSKGSSLEGPNVGIPLVVHGQALHVQQLAATCQLWGSAMDAYFMGHAQGTGKSQPRVVFRMVARKGATYNAPRIGLIQPTPPSSHGTSSTSATAAATRSVGEVGPDQDPISLTIVGGNVSIHHNLSHYLLHENTSDATSIVDTQLSFTTSPLLSLLLLDGTGGLDSHLILPFFLSLPPPGATVDLQMTLLTNSLQHLFDLYSDNAALACHLIRLLTTSIEYAGGGRWHEYLLQNGTLHCLGSCLRQSLVRAEYLNIHQYTSYTDFLKTEGGAGGGDLSSQKLKAPMSYMPISPTYIPEPVVDAMADLITVCCGRHSHTLLEALDPSMQIQRTSDLALSALFGIGLDWELWGRDWKAASRILRTLASRYGGSCLTAGYILRSQISVQFFLDTLQVALNHNKSSTSANGGTNSTNSKKTTTAVNTANNETNENENNREQREYLESISNSCADLLKSMLLSSLSNSRSISQGEHDISACMGALSDCPLGSAGAHVIFTALMGVLQWCDVMPAPMTYPEDKDRDHRSGSKTANSRSSPRINDEHKSQVATRLGRNLLASQYHDVVAPMLLSRTVFSGERTMSMDQKTLPLNWEHHWRQGLLIFSWVSTLAGTEGVIASKSMGSLLLASGLAGSLGGALVEADRISVQHLFIPPPTMAMTIVASSQKFNEWSYTDLLADRLSVMMPLLPGLVVSLISHPSDPPQEISPKALKTLAELLTAVGGNFYRVLGGQKHSATSVTGTRFTRNRDADSKTVQAANSYIPHLLIVAMLLEHHIQLREQSFHHLGNDGAAVSVLEQPLMAQKGAEDGSWVEVSSTVTDSVMSDGTIVLPDGLKGDLAVVVALQACQSSMLTTVSELMANAMRAGGGEPTTQLLRNVLTNLHESALYGVKSTQSKDSPKTDSITKRTQDNILCRLAAMILNKALKRNYQWEVWSADLGSGVSRLCLLIEEKELLMSPKGQKEGEYSNDQVLLLYAMLSILQYGRDTTGWCQLILPTPPGPANDPETHAPAPPANTAPATSKVLLPVLQPTLRCLVACVGTLSSETQIRIPDAPSSEKERSERRLLDNVVNELKGTLMASIVGMSFANARDLALYVLATLRRALKSYEIANDEIGLKRSRTLIRLVIEEIRVRYEGERRRRETALFDADAYEDSENQRTRETAAADSQAIESMILGGNLIPEAAETTDEEIEQVSFVDENEGLATNENLAPTLTPTRSEDFVVYNDGLAVGGTGDHKVARMQWSQYEGLSAALEECVDASKSSESTNDDDPTVHPTLEILSPFLDAWDENEAKEAAESELVHLFDFNLSDDRDSIDESNGRMPLQGSETAADSMTTFIELSAAEKSRTHEVSESFLPNHRYSTMAYTERFCWAKYNEIVNDGRMNSIWERGVADGNRDIRSRLVTIPCSPQFRRYIPKYLDHGASMEANEAAAKRANMVANNEDNMDEFTKALLSTGHLEIVDITKREVNEEEEPELELQAAGSMDFEEFGETPMEAPPAESEEQPDEASSTTDSSTLEKKVEAKEMSEKEVFDKTKIGSSHFNITASAFASPPDNSASTLSLMHSAAAGLIEKHLENCLHIKAEGSRKCSMLLTQTHLILEYDVEEEGLYEGEMMAVREEAERQRMIEDVSAGSSGREESVIQDEIEKRQREIAALRPKSIRWNLSELSHVYLRRYRLRDSSIEMFFIPSGGTSFGGYGLYSPSTSLFIDFGPGYEGNRRRDEAAFAVMKRAPPQTIKQWPDRSAQFLHEQLSRLTMGWVEGRITNFDYLLHLNMLAGRSYNDTCQYPVMPWVLANYSDEEIPDLRDPKNFRDLKKPVGALNPSRLEDFIERFSTFADPSIPPFMYGSHYSTNAGVVLHFLVRLHPFSGLHRQLQGGHFDVADRLFSSVPRTWDMCTGSSAAEVKELTPEWYCNPAFLKNDNKFKLGTSQDGEVLGDVDLPPWANGSPEVFVEVMRNALESDICSSMLPDWIDLIFGKKQQGPEAIKAHNVFFYLTYYGSVDVNAIEDESLRQATELQIAHFGQCPMQLFVRPHVRRFPKINRMRMSFYQVTSAYTNGAGRNDEEDESEKDDVLMKSPVFGQPLYLPFFSAPMSHWVHLDAPPPGPHASLLAVRLAGTDRCLAVDARGVFHCFRWAWRIDEPSEIDGTPGNGTFPLDGGCFIAQRELPRFRIVPRLTHTPRPDENPAVAISKTLFAGRSVLLVISDGDGHGGVAIQLVDPAKASVRGEALIESVHSAQVSCIASDPIGTAAGHGGVGGELVLVGSRDGCASIWRFMSSHYLPLRPRVRLSGHAGNALVAVGVNAAINIAATISLDRLCLHSIGNGNLLRVIYPPENLLEVPEGSIATTRFAKSPAIAISVQGFVVTACETVITHLHPGASTRSVITLHMFSLEGVSLGSKPLESWRGIPQKMVCTPDGTAVLVCSGRGVTIHRLSAITPLEFIDEWHVTETDELTSSVCRAYDIDLGPSLNRPVVAAAACSNGSLRLHALAGISAFSDRHRKLGIGQSVGSVFAAPARRLKVAVGKGWGVGSKVAGVGKEIGKEIKSDLKEKGMGGFLGNMFRNKNTSK